MDDLVGFCVQISKHKEPPVTFLYRIDSEKDSIQLYEMNSEVKNRLDDMESLRIYLDSACFTIKEMKNVVVFDKCASCIYAQDSDYPSVELALFPYKESSIESLLEMLSYKCQVLETTLENQITTDSHEDLIYLVLDNGNLYIGKVNAKGLPHSDEGKEFCLDGNLIYGSYRDGLRHGPAQIIDERLDVHSVEYIHGVLCGI
jgi:hypothetical protein